MPKDNQLHYRTCPLCEATCGLVIETKNKRVVSVKGDQDDPFSKGYMCAKARALEDLHEDPDRLRTPMLRKHGVLEPCSWDEAFAEIEKNFKKIKKEHGSGAIGIYQGNPCVHRPSIYFYSLALLRALRTRHIYSASSVDQLPKQWTSALMFGSGTSVAVPDIDRTDYIMILGANPVVSNGSLWTAPNLRGRIKDLLNRGGKMIVIDPRRTETATLATEHHFITPGTDALFLMSIVNVLFSKKLNKPGKLSKYTNGLKQIEELVQDFTPKIVSPKCSIPADIISRLAQELAESKTSVVYGRMGTCTQKYGTLGSWLVDVINLLTGNLDQPGGAMFPMPVALSSNSRVSPDNSAGFRPSKKRTRVANLPIVLGEQPVLTMADEILTKGAGSMRALITIAGNPVLSTPDANKLKKALNELEFMVSVDIYNNETSSLANVILPGLSPLEDFHYDYVFANFMVRSYARYSAPIFPKNSDFLFEWEILLRLADLVSGTQKTFDLQEQDDRVFRQWVMNSGRHKNIPMIYSDEIIKMQAQKIGPERILDLLIRMGPRGDGFGSVADGLNLAKLKAHPHGLDFGPMQSRIPEILQTASKKIETAPEQIIIDINRLKAELNSNTNEFLLIGRREILTNNSWMHNLKRLSGGKDRCTMHINPDDAKDLGIKNETMVQVSSTAGNLEIKAEVTDTIKKGVVSIPHGWGHSNAENLNIAKTMAGVNMNLLTCTNEYDVPSGNAVLNGTSVKINPV